MFLLLACVSETTLSPVLAEADTPSTISQVGGDPTPAIAEPEWEPVAPTGSAVERYDDPNNEVTREVFDHGLKARTPLVDYLFVIDDSVSMDAVLARFQMGFQSLTSDRFPTRAQVAVMTMTPAKPGDLSQPHPIVGPLRDTLVDNPGFLGLVDDDGLRRYDQALGMAPQLGGCDAWFAPTATNDAGQSCLVAHTKLALTLNVAEAGLVAFGQFLKKNRGQAVFREGAAVNVVFVSDTHDPGFQPQGRHKRQARHFDRMIAVQPDLDELKGLVEANQTVASLTFHAIAPMTECAEPWQEWLAPVYHELAAESGGVSLDICTSDDYGPVVEQMVVSGAQLRTPTYTLSQGKPKIRSVRLDNQDVSFTQSGRVLRVDAKRTKAQKLEVVYER